MLNDIKTIHNLVKKFLGEDLRTRDDDTYLLFKVWKHQGFEIPEPLATKIINNAVPPESVRRVRQKLQEGGEYQGKARQQRLFEEQEVKQWARQN
jgi:predicted solute-binding protein